MPTRPVASATPCARRRCVGCVGCVDSQADQAARRYCFTLFGTYSSDRVMAANRASFPRHAGEGRDIQTHSHTWQRASFPRIAGEGRDGGVFANRARSLASPPSPPSPVAGGRSRLVIMVIRCIKYEALHQGTRRGCLDPSLKMSYSYKIGIDMFGV